MNLASVEAISMKRKLLEKWEAGQEVNQRGQTLVNAMRTKSKHNPTEIQSVV